MKNILLVTFYCFGLIVLSGCSYSPLQGEMFEEVVIRNGSDVALTEVQLYLEKGTKNKAIQTNAIYPFSQVSLGFSPRKYQGARLVLSWDQGGRSYSKDLDLSLVSIKGRKEIYIFTVIVGGHGEVQTTAEAVR